MADDNIKSFTIEWILVGLLLFSMLTFAFSFMYFNSESGLTNTPTSDLLNSSRVEVRTKLLEVDDNSNILLNITAKTDPETGFLGSRDSVASGYGFKKEATSGWNQFKFLLGWVLTGDAGKVLLITFGGILGYLGIYYVVKYIRTGT